MKSYDVTIHENLKMKVAVEAKTAREAKKIVEERWRNGHYILDADNYSGVKFKARCARKCDHRR